MCKTCCAEAVTRRHQKMRAILLEEAGGRCAICGYDRCVVNLHFHHVFPEHKSLEMNMGAGKALATYREEAKKCVLLCANCHGEVEAELVPSPPPGAKFGEPWVPVSAATDRLNPTSSRSDPRSRADWFPLFDDPSSGEPASR
jgi:hypothetical protein